MKIHPIFNQNYPRKTDEFYLTGNSPQPSAFHFAYKQAFSDCFVKTAPVPALKTQFVNFKGFACSTENFGPRNLYDMPCGSCGKKTLLDNQIENFGKDVKDKTGEDLISALNKKQEYYCDNEREVVKFLKKSAQEYPRNNLEDLVKISKESHKNNLEKTQLRILQGIIDNARTVGKNDSIKLCEFIGKYQQIINNSDDNTHFKRKTFLNELKALGSHFGNKSAFEEILKLAQTMPTSGDSVSAFFVKYSRRTSQEIAERLLMPSLATTEHIIPQSNDKVENHIKNNTANYMVMCGDCNSKRSSMPYSKWLKIKPGMPENFRTYIDEVIKRIKTGELDGRWANYPYEVCKTVKEQTGGVISIEVEENIQKEKKCCNGNEEKPPKELSLETRIERAKKAYEARQQTLAELEQRKVELDNDPEYQAILRYFALQDSIEKSIEAKKQVSDELIEERRKQQALQKKETDIVRLVESLQDPEMSQKAKNKTNEEIRNLKLKIEKSRGRIQDIEALQRQYDSISARIKIDTHETYLILSKLSLPETIRAKEKKIESSLEERTQLVQDTRRRRNLIEQNNGLSAKKESLDAQAGQKTSKLQELSSTVDLNSPENQELLAQYKILNKKLEIAKNVDSKALARLIPQNGIAPDFLKEEAIESLNGKINALKNKDVVVYFELSAEIGELKKKLEAIEKEMAQNSDVIERLAASASKLAQLEAEKSTDALKTELEALKNRRISMQDKIDNMDIKSRICAAEDEVLTTKETYENLLQLMEQTPSAS